VTDDENEGDDCDEVIGGEWTQWGWRNEKGSWFHRWGDAYLKERLVISNDKYTDGRAKVTTDEERVLPEDW